MYSESVRLELMDGREMKLISALMLLQTAACVDRFCRFNQSDPCYAALGNKLSLQMVPEVVKIRKIINRPQDDPVCRIKNETLKMAECDLYDKRAEVTVINGALIINPVIRADSGTYRFIVTKSDGTQISTVDLQVNVEAPVGSVELSVNCSSSDEGVMRVSCSSEGDQLLYSWTLNGEPLKDENSSIDLHEGTERNISCSVKNHVSHAHKTLSVIHCPVSSESSESVVFVLVWCLQMMLLLGLLGGFHLMRHISGIKQEDQKLRVRRERSDNS